MNRRSLLLAGLAIPAVGTPTPAEIAAFVAQEGERWGTVARTVGIKAG